MNFDFYLDGAVFEGSSGYYQRVGSHPYHFLKTKKKLRQDERGFFFRYNGRNVPEFTRESL